MDASRLQRNAYGGHEHEQPLGSAEAPSGERIVTPSANGPASVSSASKPAPPGCTGATWALEDRDGEDLEARALPPSGRGSFLRLAVMKRPDGWLENVEDASPSAQMIASLCKRAAVAERRGVGLTDLIGMNVLQINSKLQGGRQVSKRHRRWQAGSPAGKYRVACAGGSWMLGLRLVRRRRCRTRASFVHVQSRKQ